MWTIWFVSFGTSLTHLEAKTDIHGLHHLLSSLRSVIIWLGESKCTKMCSGQLDLSHLVQIWPTLRPNLASMVSITKNSGLDLCVPSPVAFTETSPARSLAVQLLLSFSRLDGSVSTSRGTSGRYVIYLYLPAWVIYRPKKTRLIKILTLPSFQLTKRTLKTYQTP